MIICLGTTPAVQRSMTFGHLVIDGINRTADVSQYASGKSVNAAHVLHTLGVEVLCTGFVGGDTGQFLLKDLDDAEIAHQFVPVEPATRLCVTLIDQTAGSATELIEESRAVSLLAYEQLTAKLNQLLPRCTGLMLCGSMPPDAPVDFYASCVKSASIAGKIVMLDATGEPLRRALASHPTVVKPNRAELSQTVNAPLESDADMKIAIKALLATGPHWAVVTNGNKETVASDGARFWKISTPQIKVISPIGSGDSFAAGLMAGMSRGEEVQQACKLAAACGAANAMTDRAGHVNQSDVNHLLARITVTEF